MSTSAYAGIVSRLAALAIDGVVITLGVAAVTRSPLIAWASIAPIEVPSWLDDACAVFGALTPWLYFTWFWWVSGQTPGDLAIGIRVGGRGDRRMSLGHAALRAALGLLLAPLWLVGLIAVLWDRDRRAWHDVLLGTEVRYVAKPRPARG